MVTVQPDLVIFGTIEKNNTTFLLGCLVMRRIIIIVKRHPVA